MTRDTTTNPSIKERRMDRNIDCYVMIKIKASNNDP